MEMDLSFPGGLRVEALYNGFTISTDQPVKDGGEGGAPEPFALFLASLATCTGVYVLCFCRARDIDPQGLSLKLSTLSGPEGKGLAKVRMELGLPPHFPAKYHQAVLRVAGNCAVKKAIVNPPEMELVLADTD